MELIVLSDYCKIYNATQVQKVMDQQYDEAGKNIEESSKEEEFYGSGEVNRGVLKRAKRDEEKK